MVSKTSIQCQARDTTTEDEAREKEHDQSIGMDLTDLVMKTSLTNPNTTTN